MLYYMILVCKHDTFVAVKWRYSDILRTQMETQTNVHNILNNYELSRFIT